MKSKRRILSSVLSAALIFSFGAVVHAASSGLDFYNGKVITYIVATKPGGGYDIYARVIGKYMQKYIPGSIIIVKNVAGAGHIVGAMETYVAKPDGLTIGTFNTGLIYSQLIGQPGIKFDLAKYSWIGKANSEYRILIVGAKTRFKTFKEILESKEPVKLACSGVGSADYNETRILAEAMGLNLKVVPGFSGREGEMAILRNEVVGFIGSYTGNLTFIKSKEARVLLQIAYKKHKDLQDVPLVGEFNMSDKGKKLVSIICGTGEVGRLTAAPPKVPAARLGILRDAYRKALTDPELLKEAGKYDLEVEPLYGEEVAKLIKEALNQPEENVALLKKIVTIEQ